MRDRRRGGHRVAMAFAAALVTGVVGVVTGCGSTAPVAGNQTQVAGTSPTGQGQAGDPGATARAFLDALVARDCSSAFALVVDPIRSSSGGAAGLCAAVPVTGPYTLGETTSLTSTSSFVTVTLGSGNRQAVETITLLLKNGQWYVGGVVANGSASPGPGLNGTKLETTIAQQYQEQNPGVTATVTCPSGSSSFSAGQQLHCTYTDTSGRSGTMTVTVGTSSGAFTWSIP